MQNIYEQNVGRTKFQGENLRNPSVNPSVQKQLFSNEFVPANLNTSESLNMEIAPPHSTPPREYTQHNDVYPRSDNHPNSSLLPGTRPKSHHSEAHNPHAIQLNVSPPGPLS
jgi:hypothetical protein